MRRIASTPAVLRSLSLPLPLFLGLAACAGAGPLPKPAGGGVDDDRSPVAGQEARTLLPGERLTAEIRADEIHRLRLDLEAGQFAYVAVTEQGIDVSVKVIGPSGRLLGWYDGGVARSFRDPLSAVTLFAHESGPHWLDIHPRDPLSGSSGRYTARVERLEPAAASPLGRVEQWLSPWDLDGQPGVAVGIAVGGETVFARGYGEAVVEHGVPITPRTVFHTASLTKQFAGFAVQLLVDRGRLELDEDIRTYLPWVPDLGSTITIRHLLHHTHGLPGQLPRLALAGWDWHDVVLQRHVMDLVRRQGRLQFEPGSQYMYSNTGHELLVEAVEAVTGQTIGTWAEENIFEPLGMTNTFLLEDRRRLIPHRASAYFVDSERGVLREPESVTILLGAVGLYSTVEDQLKWAENLKTGAVGGEAVRDRMRERGRLADGTVLSYASGLEIIEYDGKTALFHGGGWGGTRSFLLVLPDDDVAIAVISNRAGFDRSRLSMRTADLLIGDTVAGNLHYRDMARYTADPVDADPMAGEPRPGRLDELAGRYVFEDAEMMLFRAGDRLWLHQRDGPPFTALRLHGDTARLVMPAVPVELVFDRDEGGTVVGLRQIVEGEPRERAAKEPPYQPGLPEIQQYEGAYRSDELRSTWTFTAEPGRLVGHHERRGGAMVLTPVAPDRFRGDGWSYEEVEFVRDGGGVVEAVLFSSPRYRAERFDRVGSRTGGGTRDEGAVIDSVLSLTHALVGPPEHGDARVTGPGADNGVANQPAWQIPSGP
jgi:CubicO group peptidase (beta-lactamase class C family)